MYQYGSLIIGRAAVDGLCGAGVRRWRVVLIGCVRSLANSALIINGGGNALLMQINISGCHPVYFQAAAGAMRCAVPVHIGIDFRGT